MGLTLISKLNGVPVTHEELKKMVLKCDAISEIIQAVNKRLNVSPNDNTYK